MPATATTDSPKCVIVGCDLPAVFEIWGPEGPEDYTLSCGAIAHLSELTEPTNTIHLLNHEADIKEMVK